MDEITITPLPRLNLELPVPKIEINSLKLQLNAPACHHHLKTVQREKISKLSHELCVSYRKKKKNSYLKEHLQSKRSQSTREYRGKEASKKHFSLKTQGSVLQDKQKLKQQRGKSEVKVQKELKSLLDVKVHKGNQMAKLIKKILPLEQRLNRYHYISSLPIIISVLQKQPQSRLRSFEQSQLIRQRFLSLKKSSAGIYQTGRNQRGFKSTLKDYKIEGWNLRQSKYESYIIQNH